MVPEVGPVNLKLAVVVHVQKLVAERILRERVDSGGPDVSLEQSRSHANLAMAFTHTHVTFTGEPVLTEKDAVVGAEASSLSCVARSAVDALGRRLAA